MESQHVSSLTAGADALMQRQQQQQRGEAQQPGAGAGWPATHPMGGYTAPAPGADSGAGALAAAAYGRWAYEHAAQAQQQQQQHAPPPQPPSGTWQGTGSGYWPATAGSTGYYAGAPSPPNGGGGSGGAGSDSTDSSDDGGGCGGGPGLRKAMFRKKGSATAHHGHHPHHHAAAVAAAARESSELERRLKKNAREQKRANKINDQIAIMKGILEDVGLRPPATKSSILSEGIALVRHLLAGTEPEKLAALRAKATGGMLGPGTGASLLNGEDTVASMETAGSESLGSAAAAGGGGGMGLQEQEPYVLLFRKSATPLAMAGPDGAHRFLDCNLRFAEVFETSPPELQQATLFTFTREADYDHTRRVLSLVSQPGLMVDESTPLEVVLTNPRGHRFLVRVSALTDDAGKPCYLLFTPKAVLPPQPQPATAAATGHAHGNGNGNGHHAVKGEAPSGAPARAPAAAAGSATSSATSSPAVGLVRGPAAVAGPGATSSEGSSIGSANSSSNSLYHHSSPHGGTVALAGTTEATMAAARTLPAHMKPMM